ncbi:MAG: TauD/TfdA family dioxygenase [Pseudomonadota bacterium]
MTLKTSPLHNHFGVEVHDIDLSALDDATFRLILDAFFAHGALLFRDQDLHPAAQVALSKRFGVLSIPPRRQFNLADHPEVSVLGNLTNPDGTPAAFFNEMGEEWHSDSAGYENLDGATFLYCIESPPIGGETMLCSMYAAWDALPNNRKADMEGRKVLHSWNFHNDKVMAVSEGKPLTPEQRALYPDHWTDLVQTHPVTGRKLYYLSHNLVKQIDDWSEERSQSYTMELVDLATTPERVYSHRWRSGDLLVWDNRATMHSATDVASYRDHVRHMHRSYSFMGDRAAPGGKLA